MAMPRPRVTLTRYHGVFAPNSWLRARLEPGKTSDKRIHVLPLRGGTLRVIADVTDPAVIDKFLNLTRQIIKQRLRLSRYDPTGIISKEIHALLDTFISTTEPL